MTAADPWATEQGRQARDAGMKASLDRRAAGQDFAVILQAIRHVASRGQPFTVDDIRGLLPLVAPELLGTAFQVAARRKLIRPVGFQPSRHPEGHARPVRLWQADQLPVTPVTAVTPTSPPRKGRCPNGYVRAADGTCCPEHADLPLCAACGQPMDGALAAAGWTEHPMCRGDEE